MSDLVWCCLSGIALTTVIIIQQSYKESFFEKSLTMIPQLQDGASQFTIDMWLGYSKLGLVCIISLPFIIFYIDVKQRPRAFYYMFTSAMVEVLTSAMKLNDH